MGKPYKGAVSSGGRGQIFEIVDVGNLVLEPISKGEGGVALHTPLLLEALGTLHFIVFGESMTPDPIMLRSKPSDVPKSRGSTLLRVVELSDLWMWSQLMWLQFEVVRGPGAEIAQQKFGKRAGPTAPRMLCISYCAISAPRPPPDTIVAQF